jgi:N-acetyl sugar amidotransferase
MSENQVCTRCVMDTTDPNITFDEQGVCNHCHHYDALKAQPDVQDKDTYENLIKKIKERGANHKYDCLVGISGGTDSSYMLHQLRNSGLRVLAVHYDSGWNSGEAYFNVKVLTDRIGIDLITYRVDFEEFRAVQLAYLKAGVVDLDVPTDHTLFGCLYDTASENDVPFIITGHNIETEAVMPDAWITDKMDAANLLDIYNKFGNGTPLKTFPLQTLKRKWNHYNKKKIEMVFMLNYVKYDKEEASKTLEELYKWQPVKVKHGESIWTRFYQCHILFNRFGIDKRKAHFSNLILSGVMTRDESLVELATPPYKYDMEEDKKMILERYRITEEEFESYMNAPKRQFSEFKSEKKMKDFYAKMRKGLGLSKLLKVSTRH